MNAQHNIPAIYSSLANLAMTHSKGYVAAKQSGSEIFKAHHEKRMIDLAETIEGLARMDVAALDFAETARYDADVAAQDFANDIGG